MERNYSSYEGLEPLVLAKILFFFKVLRGKKKDIHSENLMSSRVVTAAKSFHLKFCLFLPV